MASIFLGNGRAYRAYFLDSSDHIFRAVVVRCRDDDEARAVAIQLLSKERVNACVEVWDGARQVTESLSRDVVASA